jgi:hypothetical protein
LNALGVKRYLTGKSMTLAHTARINISVLVVEHQLRTHGAIFVWRRNDE